MICKNLLYPAWAALVMAGVMPLNGAEEARPAAVRTQTKGAAQTKAEKVIIPELSFAAADFHECVGQLFKKCAAADPEKNPQRKGIDLFDRVTDETKPVTLKLANISTWDAAQKIAEAAGVKVFAKDNALMFHGSSYTPLPESALAAWRKSKEWETAVKIKIPLIAFANAPMKETCERITERAATSAGKGVKKLTVTFEGVEASITMHAKDVKLNDLIESIAEEAHAEVTAEEGKVVFRPLKTAKE